MRRLTIKVILLALCGMLILSACGSKDIKNEQAAVKVIRLATDLNEEDAAYRQLKRFAEKVEDTSEGKMKIKLYTDGKWSEDEVLTEYLATGALEMACLSTDVWAEVIPQYELYSYPTLFADSNAVANYALSQSGQNALKINSDYQLLGFTANGYSYFVHKFWAENYYNYKGSTFYADISATTANVLKSLGIGVVNEENNTPGVNHIVTEGYLKYLVQINVVNESTYVTNPDVYYNLEAVAVSPKFWQSLSEEEQTLLREAFNAALKEECSYQKERGFKEILPDGGVSFIVWSAESQAQAGQALKGITENYIRSSQNPLGSYFVPTYTDTVNGN